MVLLLLLLEAEKRCFPLDFDPIFLLRDIYDLYLEAEDGD